MNDESGIVTIALTFSSTGRSSSAMIDCCRLNGSEVRLFGAEPVPLGVVTADEAFKLFSKLFLRSDIIKFSSSAVGNSMTVMVISWSVGLVRRKWMVIVSEDPKKTGGALMRRMSGMWALAYNWMRYLIDGGLNSGFKTLCWHCLQRSDRLIEILLCCGYKLLTENGWRDGFWRRCLRVVTDFKLIGCVNILSGNWLTSSLAVDGEIVGFFFTVSFSDQPIWRRTIDAVMPVRSCERNRFDVWTISSTTHIHYGFR